jgi:hypothetical protein
MMCPQIPALLELQEGFPDEIPLDLRGTFNPMSEGVEMQGEAETGVMQP